MGVIEMKANYETERVKLGLDKNPRKIVEEAFDGHIPTHLKYSENIEYLEYDHGGVKIQTDHPDESKSKFWRGVQNRHRGSRKPGGSYGFDFEDEIVEASEIREKWLEVLSKAQEKKHTKSVEEAVKENGFEDFEHFVHEIKRLILEDTTMDINEAISKLENVLISYDTMAELDTERFFQKISND